MDEIKIAKELIKVAQMLVAAPQEEQNNEQEDMKITDMLKDIVKNKSKFSQLKSKKCKMFDVTGGQIGSMSVEELIAALHKIAMSA